MFAGHALLAWLAALLAATLGFLRSRYEIEARHLATIGALATIPAVLIAGVYYYANQDVVQIISHQEVITCTGPQLQPPRDACELANFTSKVLKLYGISPLVGIALLGAAGSVLGAALRGSEGLQNWGRARIFGLGTASVLFGIGLVSLWLLPEHSLLHGPSRQLATSYSVIWDSSRFEMRIRMRIRPFVRN
jgi:hypothetical protein